MSPHRLKSWVTAASELATRDGHTSHVTTPATTAPDRARVSSTFKWFRGSDGRLTLWQWPNPALWVWLVTLVLGWLELSAAHASTVDGMRRGALVVWALDELVRGASPFRRTLGAVILAAQLGALALQ